MTNLGRHFEVLDSKGKVHNYKLRAKAQGHSIRWYVENYGEHLVVADYFTGAILQRINLKRLNGYRISFKEY